jgi:hypothetical protein
MTEQTTEFIDKSTKVHGDLYDYSNVEYINNHTKVVIICKKHGEFTQTPGHHLGKQGCPYCGGRTKSNTGEFITKAKEIHGDVYDYSNVNYINNHTKVVIICKTHGPFEQVPPSHLRQGCGCPDCGGRKKSNTKEFIIKAQKVHGDLYDYSKIVYINAGENVIIICKIHGEFEQTPSGHLCGSGCRICGYETTAQSRRLNTEKFIIKATEVHGDLYDYSNVEYINNHTKVIIICKKHGHFEQQPSNHLMKRGCVDCGREQCGNINSSNVYEFITKAKEIHGDLYDYSKVVYVKSNENVVIICKKHGEFPQTPTSHLGDSGCRHCGNLRISEVKSSNVDEFIEKARNIHGDLYDYSKVIYVKSNKNVIIICKKHGIFNMRPNNHIGSSQGCPECQIRKTYSISQIKWLEFMSKSDNTHIQHAENGGEFRIPFTNYKADGYCEDTKTIYEFHGDFWHGNPKRYILTDMNPMTKTTYKELYANTLQRDQQLRELGYNLIIMWEYDWKQINKGVIFLQRKFKLK